MTLSSLAQKYYRLSLIFGVFLAIAYAFPSQAAAFSVPSQGQWLLGEVESVSATGQAVDEYTQQVSQYQEVQVRILRGDQAGAVVEVRNESAPTAQAYVEVESGDNVILYKGIDLNQQPSYAIIDFYRITPVVIIVVLFFVLVMSFGWKRGVTSIIGLLSTVFILVFWIIPRIMAGDSPLVVSVVGSVIIMVISLYLAHGFNQRTSLALISSCIILLIAIFIAMVYTWLTHLTGFGSEEVLYLQFGTAGAINAQGLLLAGMIIGVLGVLDDITTAQSAAVDELVKANPSLQFKDVFRRGFSIGREHIASLVNTLVLAYAGAALPLLLLFTINTAQPWWVVLNSEAMVEEIVRTIVGSMALVLGVPLTTALAAYWFTKKSDIV